MSARRKAPRRDGNEAEIIAALRAGGASVAQLSDKGLPDLAVGFTDPATGESRNLLMEVKMPKGKLEPDQIAWHANWRGQVAVVRTVDEALRLIGRIGANND